MFRRPLYVCVWLAVLALASCSTHNTAPLTLSARDASHFTLTVGEESFIDGGSAAFALDVVTNPTGPLVQLKATGARGLKAVVVEIAYDAAIWTPTSTASMPVLGGPDELITIEVLDQPGCAHLGQVLANWPDRTGFSGEGVLAELQFAAGQPAARQCARIVPDTDASRMPLGWDQQTGTLTWAYANQGDYNQDKTVGIGDITPIGQYFNVSGPFDPMSALAMIDGNDDGQISIYDLTPIGFNFGITVEYYKIYASNDIAYYPLNNTMQETGAEVLGVTFFEDGIFDEGMRGVFTFTVPDWEESDLFWVRPAADHVVGTPSDLHGSSPFGVTISADGDSGEVPFSLQFTATPVENTGAAPFDYEWQVFSDAAPELMLPTLTDPPALAMEAVALPLTPDQYSTHIHFANTGDGAEHSYAVRCRAVDALGHEAFSNLLRVNALSNIGLDYYQCHPALVTHWTEFPASTGGESANPIVAALPVPEPHTARVNPAVCSHPSGVVFILGGERVDADGQFKGLVERGDSAYCYVPATLASGGNDNLIGKLSTEDRGYLIRLNDAAGPNYPGSPVTPFSPQWPNQGGDTRTPVMLDPESAPAMPPAVQAQRTARFEIVGSAGAVLMHERPETNPAGAYPDRGFWADIEIPYGESLDRSHQGFPTDRLWAWPDSPVGWQLESVFDETGLGTPVIYVLGGRTGGGTSTDLVQKYYPYGFGTEDLVPWSQDLEFQVSGRQVDVWSPYFLRPDTDQFPGPGINHAPHIADRPGIELPRLPRPLYGHAVLALETGVDIDWPVYPNEPYHYVYLLGGIDDGYVLDEVRIWDTGKTGTPGVDSEVFTALPPLPQPRAYGQAVAIPGDPLRIALAGGYGVGGLPLKTVDVFTFENRHRPSSGSWETFAGALPEALAAYGMAYSDAAGGQLVFLGANTADPPAGDGLVTSLGALGAGGELISGLDLLPCTFAALSQSGSTPLSTVRQAYALPPLTFNRLTLIGYIGSGEPRSVVTVLGLPAGP